MPRVKNQSKISVSLDRRCGLTQNANLRLQSVAASPEFEYRYQESQSDLFVRKSATRKVSLVDALWPQDRASTK